MITVPLPNILRRHPVQQAEAVSWPSPEEQIVQVESLNLGMEIPSVPHVILNGDEVLLLCAYLPDRDGRVGLLRTYDFFWNAIRLPKGIEKDQHPAGVRLAPGSTWEPGIRWVVFRPSAYSGVSPTQAKRLATQDGVRLAGIEVLMAAYLCPDWVRQWGNAASPYPWLTGLCAWTRRDWGGTPHLALFQKSQMLCLQGDWPRKDCPLSCSPSIREVS